MAEKETSLDLKMILEYPLSEYALSLAKPCGSLNTTDKSQLTRIHEKCNIFTILEEDSPPPVGATLINGGLLLHSISSLTGRFGSYGALSRHILANVLRSRVKNVYVLFETYLGSSVKDGERRRRGKEHGTYIITGPKQVPRQSISQLLYNP